MKLDEFVRSVINQLTSLGAVEGEIHTHEIVDELNNVGPSVRLEDIVAGNKVYYTIKRNLPVSLKSFDTPTLNEVKLTPPPVKELDTPQSITRAYAYTTPISLKKNKSYDKGSVARDGEDLYQCVDNVDESVDSTDKTFNETPLHLHKDAKYQDGDVVYDPVRDHFYRATDTQYDGEIPEGWTRLYWTHIGRAGAEPNYLRFEDLRSSQLINNAFSVYDDTLWITPDVGEIVLWYVPEWTDVEDKDDDIDLANRPLNKARDMILQRMRQKLSLGRPQPEEENE